MSDVNVNAPGEEVRRAVRRFSLLFLVQGLLLVVAGFFAIVYPLLSSVAVTLLLGWMLIVSGVVQLATLLASRAHHFWPQLISAVVALVTGLLIIRNPAVAVSTLALLLVIFFMVEGIAKIIFALTVRPLRHWFWVLVSGIIGVLISLYLISNPVLSFVALGLFIGIQLISEGLAIGSMAWRAREV